MPASAHFTPELFAFLRQLKRNNNRPWFGRNKERYEALARDPALVFIAEFAPLLRKLSPAFVADARPARGSLFRVYRDTRFSADKTPYKTHLSMYFPHAAPAKSAHAPRERDLRNEAVHTPGFYLHVESQNCYAAAGLWRPDTRALQRVREAMVRDPQAWKRARRGLEIEGDHLARPPRGFPAGHPLMDDLKQKDFTTSVAFTETEVCRPRFLADFAAECRRMAPLVRFLCKALGMSY